VTGTCLGAVTLQNNKNMMIQGGWSTDFTAHDPALYPTTLRATGGSAVTVRNEGIEPQIYDVTITGGSAARGAGVYIVNASPVFSNVTILNNHANTQGGGVFVDVGSKPNFVDSRIENNSASVGGAGVYINGGSGKFERVIVNSNTGATDGGGFYFKASDAQVVSGEIRNHSVGAHGGGVYMSGSRAQVLDTLIQDNSAGASGGGVYAYKSPATLQFNRIIGNHTNAGEMKFVPFIFDLALVERRGGGGGVYAEASDIRILNNYIAKNSAGASGGHVGVGIHMWLFEAAEVSGNMIVDNHGNGVYMRQNRSIFKFFLLLPPLMPPPFGPELILPLATPPPAKLYHNTIARNSGAGIYGYSQTNLEMANNLIWENSGGGIKLGEEIIPHLIVIIVPGFGFFVPIPIIYPTFYPSEGAADFTFWGPSVSFSTSGAFTDGSHEHDFAGENPGFQDPNNGNYHLKRVSLAFQNAKASGQSQDIDGNERKQGLKPDIGADEYEFRRTRYATVGGTDAAGDHLCLDWKRPCTLQTAIDSAEDGDLIKVAGYTDGRAYSTIINRDGHNTVAIIRKNVTIQGGYCETTTAQSGVMQCDWERPHPETYKTVFDAQGAGRGLTIETDKYLEVFDVHITGGSAELGGGLYVISSTAVLSNVAVFGNQATNGGGAYFVGSKAVMVDSQVHDNTATQGGGLYVGSADAVIFQRSTLTSNQATDGGAVYANGSKSKILDNTITGNSASGDGGAFYLVNSAIGIERNQVGSNNARRGGGFFLATGEPSVISNTVTLNQAAVDGGGFYLVGGAGVVQENIVTANQANSQADGTGRGGGAYLENTKVNFKENQVRQNSARTGGGLHLFAASDAIVDGNQVDDNTAVLDGGGFHLDASAAILTNNSVTGNRGRNGGGLYLFNFSSAQLGNTTVLSNTATEDGGGLYFRLSNASIDTALIRANRARTGGAVFAKLSKLTLSQVHAQANQSSTLGGAIYLDESDSTVMDSSFYSNTATLDGGGLYILRSGGALLQGIDAQGNQAGGNGGAVYLSDSSIGVLGRRMVGNRAAGNGGGLYADKSDATVEQFLVQGNQAVDGAGIYLASGSDAALASNAFVDNIATGRGGALAILGSSPTFVQTTFARNQGGEAVYVDVFGPVTSLLSFLNTIVADQPVALSLTEKNSATLSVTLWHNVDVRWNGPVDVATGDANIEDDPLFAADGYHLLKDSPAINQGAKTTASKDVDGESIPQAGVPDIGADEFPVPCVAQIERDPGRTYTSVQSAVDAAATGDLIKVAGVCREVTERNGLRQVLYLDKNVTLRGGYDPDNWTASYPMTQVTSIQPISTARSIYISGGVTPLIESLTIQGGNGSGQGGGPDGQDAGSNLYVVDASPVFSNTVIRDGGSVVYGGAGFLLRSDAQFITNTVATNSAVAGAAFFLSDSTATFTDNFFERNGASKDGGAFFLSGSTAQISANTFKQNSAGTAAAPPSSTPALLR
ncbi:MAG: right-handed parallel beta-helix repeat-containing protein, partial [Caldilineaceae bacterium]